MAGLLDLAAEQLADEWLADLPAGDVFAPIVARGTAAVLGAVVGWCARRLNKSVEQTARLMFAVPASAPSAKEAAAHITRVVLGWLPPELRTAGAAVRARTAPPTPPEPPPENAQRDGHDALREIIAAIEKRPEMQTIADDLKDFASSTLQAAATATPRSYDPERIIREMGKLLRRLAKASPRVNRLLAEMEREALELPVRFATATAIAAVDLADLRTIPSSPEIGNAVHRKIRDRYRDAYPANTVISEGRVYTPATPAGTPLSKAAVSPLVPFADYRVYRVSRFSIFSPIRGNLRDDLVDFWSPLRSYGKHWEVKPARGAAEGVAQATWYRFAYNVWAIFAEDALHFPMRTRRLNRGHGGPLTSAGVLAPFPLPGNSAYQVVPIAIEALGDLIVYWIVEIRGLLPEVVAVLSATILALLREALKKAKEALDKLEEWGAAAWAWLRGVMEALDEVLREHWGLILFCLVVLALVVIVATFPVSGPVLAGATAVLLIVGAATIVFPEQQQQQQPGQPTIAPLGANTPGERDPRVTVTFGSCTLVNVPVSVLARIRAGVGPLASEAVAALVAAFPPEAPATV